jgi:transketolase
MNDINVFELKKISRQIRITTLEMLRNSKSGHPGSSLSCVDILVALYYKVLRKCGDSRDKFLLSKGHAAPALYSILIHMGEIQDQYKYMLRKGGSPLQGHPDERFLSRLDSSSGSLGQNLSIAVGIALGQKRKKSNHLTYILLGDGELQEGQVWEAAQSASHYKLDNLIAIVDNNRLQLDGPTEEIMALGDLQKKWNSFGWDTEVVDGHDFNELISALQKKSRSPKCVIANTIKGKGVSFMENAVEWHSIHDPEAADSQLEKAINKLMEAGI